MTSTNHRSHITPSLDRMLYQIRTRVAFDFGEYVFDYNLKQVESYVAKNVVISLHEPNNGLCYPSLGWFLFCFSDACAHYGLDFLMLDYPWPILR